MPGSGQDPSDLAQAGIPERDGPGTSTTILPITEALKISLGPLNSPASIVMMPFYVLLSEQSPRLNSRLLTAYIAQLDFKHKHFVAMHMYVYVDVC